MKFSLLICSIAIAVIALWAGGLVAAEPIIYPTQNQDEAQQALDNSQCYSWARGQTGFDPMAPPAPAQPPPPRQARKGGLARGALRGAAIGGIIDGSDGAKTGAAAGAALGGMRRIDQNRDQAQAQAQWEAQQKTQLDAQRASYDRAFAACMEGRGYTVR